MPTNTLKMRKICFVFSILLLTNQIVGQKIEFGIGGGMSHFKGDVSPNFNPLQFGIGGNALFRYNISRSVSLRGQFMIANYNAKDENVTDEFHLKRNYTIAGNIKEFSAIAEYNFLDKGKLVKNRDLIPYLFGGIGLSLVNNKSHVPNLFINFTAPVIPYGVGIKYRFKGPFTLCGEFGNRFIFSDELDKSYSQYLGKTNNSAGNNKYFYGDLSRKDQYFYTSLTLTYTIFNVICPD